MVETKYDKYFITYQYKPGEVQAGGRANIARIDNSAAKGSNFYWIHWNNPRPDSSGFVGVGHPPHIHKDAELLFLIGTDTNNPLDLGAEVELYMGPEMEKHVITKSSVVYIPPNFIHCPYIVKRTDRPWIFMEVNQGPVHTEKFFPQLLTKEQRASVDWSRWKDEGY